MSTDVIPILRVSDAAAATAWYAPLGFTVEFEHRFEPHLPAYVGIRREGARLHLSEHLGDARPDTLVYIWVDDIDAVATHFTVEISEAPWAREIELVDLDGNRLRIAQPLPSAGVDRVLGEGSHESLCGLEAAMWQSATRNDRAWMDAHLAADFTEVGYSGQVHSRVDSLAPVAGEVIATLHDIEVRPIGRDAAQVTYRTLEPRGAARRSSIWRRSGGGWQLVFHQGTPAG